MQKVSVIVPVKNEGRHIADLLGSLQAQSVKPDEIIIVDGGSTDGTAGIVEDCRKKGMPLRLIAVTEALPGKGRNIAIENAKNEIIAMTDGGIILDRDWLKNIVAPFAEDSSLEVVHGLRGCRAVTTFEECFALVYLPANRALKSPFRNFPFVASTALKKYVWEKAGKFREDLRAGEDLLFLKKLKESKFRTIVAYNAVAYWRPRSSFREGFSLAFKYAVCDAKTRLHLSRHFRKYLMYSLGALLAYAGLKNPVWFVLLAAGFVLDILLVCRKHWNEFLKLVGRNPGNLFTITAIIIILDIAGLCGFSAGLIRKIFKHAN
ncbi:MAG: glycosyltransferase [Candidatus Omnitrophota bacterium]|jgi:glycosyltransferase involved in cell wall biosynthesis